MLLVAAALASSGVLPLTTLPPTTLAAIAPSWIKKGGARPPPHLDAARLQPRAQGLDAAVQAYRAKRHEVATKSETMAVFQRRKRVDGLVAQRDRQCPLAAPVAWARMPVAPAQLSVDEFHAHGLSDIDLRDPNDSRVGRIRFILDSPDPFVQELQRSSCVSVAELKAIDVVEGCRGAGGGPTLLRAMAEVLRQHRVHFVLLSLLDKGSGKLVRWYESLGFRFAKDALSGVEGMEHVTANHMIVEMRVLDEMIRRALPAPTQWGGPKMTAM